MIIKNNYFTQYMGHMILFLFGSTMTILVLFIIYHCYYYSSSPYIRSPIGSASDKLRLLSPAARRLIRHSTTPGTLKGDRSLRASYSTTPLRSNVSTPNRTPNSYGEGSTTPSLTDNLLNLK